MKTNLLVLGDVNIDITGAIDDMPSIGGCAFGTAPSIHLGGAGLNTAFAAHKLGIYTTLVSKIGCDFWGDWAIEAITEQGLDVKKIERTDKWTTGIVFTILIKGERTFFSFRKTAADNHMLPSDIEGMDLECENIFLSGTVVFESDESFDTYMGIIESFHAKGANVFFDPNARPDNSTNSERVKRILRATDVFLPSDKELSLVFGTRPEDDIIAFILKCGVKDIWIKRGAKGCELVTEGQRISFPSVNASVVDTSGAGDAFDGCVVWGYIKGFPVQRIGRYANAYAALSTEHIGAGDVFPTLSQFIKSPQYVAAKEGENG